MKPIKEFEMKNLLVLLVFSIATVFSAALSLASTGGDDAQNEQALENDKQNNRMAWENPRDTSASLVCVSGNCPSEIADGPNARRSHGFADNCANSDTTDCIRPYGTANAREKNDSTTYH